MNELLQHSGGIFCDRHFEVLSAVYSGGGLQANVGPVARQCHVVRCQELENDDARGQRRLVHLLFR